MTVGLLGKPIELDCESLTLREINQTGSFTHNKESWIKAIELLNERKVELEPMWPANIRWINGRSRLNCLKKVKV